MRDTIKRSIQKGITYLKQNQRPSGEFPTYASPHIDMRGATPYPKIIYTTTFVIHALSFLRDYDGVEGMLTQAANFLERERDEHGGAWNYEGRGGNRVHSDLDDTCCAVAALALVGRLPDLQFYSLLWQNQVETGGPHYTWVGINNEANRNNPSAYEIDGLVNANILFCYGLLAALPNYGTGGTLPGTEAYLNKLIAEDRYLDEAICCISGHFLRYIFSRAYADGQVIGLAPLVATIQNYILSQSTPDSAFDLACHTTSLLNSNANLDQIQDYISKLAQCQQVNGNWPARAVYRSFTPNYDASPALTTALALESLAKYAKGILQ